MTLGHKNNRGSSIIINIGSIDDNGYTNSMESIHMNRWTIGGHYIRKVMGHEYMQMNEIKGDMSHGQTS